MSSVFVTCAVTGSDDTVGMKPLRVRAEIDAHIADRLLEAVWRDALWLVNDGVATTEEIDDAITYGFGPRWAQMGLFETNRTAGGRGEMRQLMDTPELTDGLIDAIAAPSDQQSVNYEVRELERIRDRNLTSTLLALEGNDWGAGRTVATLRSSQ
jgi:carnitine 3-dehydrogenase